MPVRQSGLCTVRAPGTGTGDRAEDHEHRRGAAVAQQSLPPGQRSGPPPSSTVPSGVPRRGPAPAASRMPAT